MTTKVTKTKEDDQMPEWESVEEAIDYFNAGISQAMLTLTRIMWEAGHAGLQLRNDSKYGDNAIETFAVGIRKGKSWIYECIKMAEAYSWTDIQDKFLKAGIPASSIARLSSISDEGARAYVEDKLLSNEITYEEIAACKKEYNEKVNNPDVSHGDAGDGEEPTIEETQMIDNLPDDDPSVPASAAVRRQCGKVEKKLDELTPILEDHLDVFANEMDMISDEGLYEVSEERFVDTALKLTRLRNYIDNIVDTAKRVRPEKFEEG